MEGWHVSEANDHTFRIGLKGILDLEKRFRTTFINSVSGMKTAFLCGTIDKSGNTNLAIMNSIVHVGANPPLLGMIVRPHLVPRHTLENIIEMRCYTLNVVHESFVKQAHHTAARFDKDQSEFHAARLTPFYSEHVAAPYVKESALKIGLEFKEKLSVTSNGTHFIIGKIKEINLPKHALSADGFVDPQMIGAVAAAGLDAYFVPEKIARFGYPKPDRPVQEIDDV
jgi:flavin reductase (DIM6/NTAB) family NADH-FMN oxidoreductase RutF